MMMEDLRVLVFDREYHVQRNSNLFPMQNFEEAKNWIRFNVKPREYCIVMRIWNAHDGLGWRDGEVLWDSRCED